MWINKSEYEDMKRDIKFWKDEHSIVKDSLKDHLKEHEYAETNNVERCKSMLCEDCKYGYRHSYRGNYYCTKDLECGKFEKRE